MRAPIFALAGLALGLACTIRPKTDTAAQPAQPPPPAAGPGSDPCAVYVERAAPGVRCQAIDATHCQCELVAAGPNPDAGTPPPANNTPPVSNTPPPANNTPPPANVPTATLEFAAGPQNTIVQCIAGPCPTRSADFITEPYPPIPLVQGNTRIQLEFRARDYQPFIGNYDLVPGRNPIAFTLTRESTAPQTAIITFEGAPSGLTVACVSGPCVDTKAHEADKFPEMPLKDDGVTVLLRFNAPGYRTAMTSFQVRRGRNSVPVLMERAPLGK